MLNIKLPYSKGCVAFSHDHLINWAYGSKREHFVSSLVISEGDLIGRHETVHGREDNRVVHGGVQHHQGKSPINVTVYTSFRKPYTIFDILGHWMCVCVRGERVGERKMIYWMRLYCSVMMNPFLFEVKVTGNVFMNNVSSLQKKSKSRCCVESLDVQRWGRCTLDNKMLKLVRFVHSIAAYFTVSGVSVVNKLMWEALCLIPGDCQLFTSLFSTWYHAAFPPLLHSYTFPSQLVLR